MTGNRASAATFKDCQQQAPHMHRRDPPVPWKSLPRNEKRKFNRPETLRGEKRSTTDAIQAAVLQRNTCEGSGSSQSATGWFDAVNKNVETGQRQSPHSSDDPPFYLSTHQPLRSANVVSSGGDELFGVPHQKPDDSEKYDLRDVIDDLTVENKRLKTLLKGQTMRQNSGPDTPDRLFELRVHGLSAHKKRELEHLLRNFAFTLGGSSTSTPTPVHGFSRQNTSELSLGSGQHGLAKNLHTDSGYTSNSGSVPISDPMLSVGKSPLISKSRRNKDIQSYLHDIPDTLLPRQSPFMTERVKMTLVVRRLEQLFTGNVAAPGEHSQPLQQQAISQSAARTDITFTNQLQMPEGSREAHMLPQDSVVNLDNANREASPPPRIRKLRHETTSASIPGALGSLDSDSSPPEQRPTRPLDLDIHRAQIVDENVEYLRHLGLASPHINTAGERKESSWMYLNLLIGMAQLHTINVTPAFIRRAIRRVSKKFELSPDGDKVRWRGGPEGTIFSQEEERAMEVGNECHPDSNEDLSASSRRSQATTSSINFPSEETSFRSKSGVQTNKSERKVSPGAATHNPISRPTTRTGSAFDYQPLFYRQKKHALQDSYLDSTSSSHSSGDSSGLVNVLSRSHLDRRPSNEGAITFFNNPYFCSDASADRNPIDSKATRRIVPWSTLGVDHGGVGESALRHHDACYFTPQFAAQPDVANSEEHLIELPLTVLKASGENETQPIQLPVSGLGGIYPEDNFALDVKVGRQLHPEQPSSQRVPFTGTRKRHRYSYRTLRCETLSLQPSKLPPPSYIFFTSSSSSDNPDTTDTMDASGASDTSSSADEEYPAPPAFLNHWSTGSSEDGGDGDNDGSSIDMLATARATDHDRIAAAERAFMLTRSNSALKMGGSLAATVGASRGSSSAGDDADIMSDEDVAGSDMDIDDENDDDDDDHDVED